MVIMEGAEEMMTISELIDAYWDCAYLEGKEGRTYDTINGDAQRIRSQIDAHLSQPQPVAQGEAVACMFPSIVSFKKAVRTSCPPELQDELEGTVAWHPEVFIEDTSVVDKHGVVHRSYPLYGLAPADDANDAKRYRWLMVNASIEAHFGAVSMKTIPPDEPGHAKILWDAAIDTALTASPSTGGV